MVTQRLFTCFAAKVAKQVYDNKRWSLVCFIKLCDALNIHRNKMRDWINDNRKELKILDPLWNDIQKLPLVTLQNINLFL